MKLFQATFLYYTLQNETNTLRAEKRHVAALKPIKYSAKPSKKYIRELLINFIPIKYTGN